MEAQYILEIYIELERIRCLSSLICMFAFLIYILQYATAKTGQQLYIYTPIYNNEQCTK